ncbi:MAG TPA: methionyl-tRNA formyltransferase [bacterium]|nr:methionyl-tRNA formyltransferase [bacterium]
MKVIFMGTPDFALRSLEAVYRAGIEIAAVVTQPDRPQGRGNKIIFSPVKQFAVEKGILVFQPEKVKSIVEDITKLDPDFILVVAFGQILPDAVLQAPRYCCINVHASLLPKYRGAAPINWAVIRGDEESGVATMILDEGMDTGDVLLMRKTEISPDETAGELHDRLALIGADLLVETVENYDSIEPQPQNVCLASYAPKMKKEYGEISWDDDARKIHNLVRGCNPWPGAYAKICGDVMKIWKTSFFSDEKLESLGEPGTVIRVCGEGMDVVTGDGIIRLLEVQREGKKRQHVSTFIIGCKLTEGFCFE